jgi:hypothetical protein
MTVCKGRHARFFSTASQLLRFERGLPENKAKHDILTTNNVINVYGPQEFYAG